MTLDVHAEIPSTPLSPSEAAVPFVLPRRRTLLAAPAVAGVTMAAALLATGAAGVPLRDPDTGRSGSSGQFQPAVTGRVNDQ
jgi:hypothetical protein